MIIDSDHPASASALAAREAPQRLLLADVRKDMAAIFGEARGTTEALPRRAMPVRKADPRQPVPRRGAAGPVLCAALGGAILGMAAIGLPGLIDRMTATPRTTEPATTVVENPFEAAVATPPDSIRPAPPATTDAPAARPAQPSPPPSIATMAKAESAPPKPAARSNEARASTESAPRGSQCEGDRLERHWCMRHDILEADRNLRLAYAKAIREGVERRYLVAHQRRWTELRDRATRDPDAVLAGYRALADDLERLAVNGRRQDRIS